MDEMTTPGPPHRSGTYSRRQVLRYGTAAGAAVAAAGLLDSTAAASEPVEVLIIGSGYAGSVAALRIAQAGFSSVVLERGRRWEITPAGNTFATPEKPDGRLAWLSSTSPFTDSPIPLFTGVLEAFMANGAICLAGAGVGGGSLVNNAMMMAPREDLFRASFGAALPYAEMASTWYPRARQLIGVAPIPDDVLATAAYGNAREFLAQAARAGLPTQRPDMAVNWQTVRNEIAGTAVPSAILGQSLTGINSGAKRSVDRSIMAAAEATGKVSVQTLHQVLDIRPMGDRYIVDVEQLDEQGHVLSRPQFAATYVILAAGSIGTSRLLVRAKARGSLPRLNDQVGLNWGTGGDHIVTIAGLPLPDPAQGGPAHVVATDWDNPNGAVTMLSFPLGLPPVGSLTRTALAVASPPAVGSFAYQPLTDAVELTWPLTDAGVARSTATVQRLADRLNAASGGPSIDGLVPLLTSHSLGGAVLGKATRDDGELLGYTNLFAMDGSLIPGSTGSVPPALTITALADRCVTRALDRLSSAPSAKSATILT
jgi:cholesterol oxidase